MQNSFNPHATPVRKSRSQLLQQVRNHTRVLHMSIRTEDAYIRWIEDYLRYHRDRKGEWKHPRELGSRGVNEFLT